MKNLYKKGINITNLHSNMVVHVATIDAGFVINISVSVKEIQKYKIK